MNASMGDSPSVPSAFRHWFEDARKSIYTHVERVPLASVTGWHCDPDAPALTHHTGRFFSIEGIRTHHAGGPVEHWDQPVINQPETGILGILVRRIDGELHCLMQAKAEPGNINGLQLSPTVQATRSNFTGVHRGKSVPYLRYFREAGAHRILADSRQSEQGTWFLRKRNRNMIVETAEEVPAAEGFRWLPLGELLGLLRFDDLVGMDARSVLACLPFPPDAPASPPGGRSGTAPLLSWITEARSRIEVTTERVPLPRLERWRRDPLAISHESGRFFDVIGVRVKAAGREVAAWGQPMIAAHGTGLVAFLVTRVEGVLHVLVRQRVEPGFVDVLELGPTVQCTPRDHDPDSRAGRPRFLDEVLGAGPDRILFDTVLSDEGGRLFHTRSRHLIVETGHLPEPPGYRWTTPAQLSALLRHSHYVTMQARSLLACLHALEHPAYGTAEAGRGEPS